MNAQNEKIAVIVLNLGGPDAPESIRPFLFNFFMDKNIIRAPLPLRFIIAGLIAWRRGRKEAWESYAHLGGKSPLLENTKAQAQALERALGRKYRCFVCMRYWHPMADEVAQQVTAYAPDKIVLLPLYPQYSTTTTRSAVQNWRKAAKRTGLQNMPESVVCCYPDQAGYLRASAEYIREAYDRAREETGKKPRILFSAHGLPEDVIADGDPYQAQCVDSAEKIIAALAVENPDWAVCYQSRVGPKRWIGPSTEAELERAAHDGVPVVIYPHAFVNEHVETLVEIEIEYREKAEELGVSGFYRVPVAGTHPAFIAGLQKLVQDAAVKAKVFRDGPCCGDPWRRCGQKEL